MANETTYFAIELVTRDGDQFHEIVDDADRLSSYVRVNAADAAFFRISAVDADNLARLRIHQIFEEDA